MRTRGLGDRIAESAAQTPLAAARSLGRRSPCRLVHHGSRLVDWRDDVLWMGGGSSHPENFWRMVIPAVAALTVLSAVVLFAWRHARWFYWIALVLLAIVSWSNVAGLYKGLVHPTEECGIGFALAVTGLFLCPLSAALLAARTARAYYAALVAYRRPTDTDATR